MQVHRSGYYKYLKNEEYLLNLEKVKLLAEVKKLYEESDGSYGSRRISKGLRENGYNVGRYRARQLMYTAHLRCQQRRRFKVTTESDHRYPVARNILNREFSVTAPNRVWVADITYLWTQEGWLYLSAVLDLFSRRIVGWSIAEKMEEKLVRDALLMALGRRCPRDELMHHSDRGSQYASENYQRLLKRHEIKVSMSRKGNCWDNAVMERFFGSLKSERINHKSYKTREDARKDVIDYIEMFYNSRRLHSTLNYKTPMKYEENYYVSQNLSTFT
jgi:transposase InsO family protein